MGDLEGTLTGTLPEPGMEEKLRMFLRMKATPGNTLDFQNFLQQIGAGTREPSLPAERLNLGGASLSSLLNAVADRVRAEPGHAMQRVDEYLRNEGLGPAAQAPRAVPQAVPARTGPSPAAQAQSWFDQGSNAADAQIAFDGGANAYTPPVDPAAQAQMAFDRGANAAQAQAWFDRGASANGVGIQTADDRAVSAASAQAAFDSGAGQNPADLVQRLVSSHASLAPQAASTPPTPLAVAFNGKTGAVKVKMTGEDAVKLLNGAQGYKQLAQGYAGRASELQGPAGENDYLRGGMNGSLQQNFMSGQAPGGFLNSNLRGISDFFDAGKARRAEESRTPFSASTNPDGTVTLEMHGEDAQKLFASSKAFHELAGAAQSQTPRPPANPFQTLVQGQLDQLGARQAQVQRQPLASLLAQLAGNIAASDPKLPGWVRGAGLTAQQLNPSIQQLQQQQIGLAQTLAQLQHQGFSQQLGLAELGVKQQNANTEALGEKNRELATSNAAKKADADRQQKAGEDFLNRARDAAEKYGILADPNKFASEFKRLNPQATVDDIASAYGPISDVAAGHRSEEVAKENRAKQNRIDAATDIAKAVTPIKTAAAEEIDAAKQAGRVALVNLNWEKKTSQSAFDFTKKVAEMKAQTHQAFANTDLKGPELKQAEGAFATNKYLDTLEGVLKRPELAGYVGPLFSMDDNGNVTSNAGRLLPRFAQSADRAKVENLLTHEIPRLLNLVLNGQGGGSRLLQSPQGQKMLADLGINKQTRPDQALAILGNIRDQNNTQLLAIKTAHPNITNDALFGIDNPNNAYFWKQGQDTFGQQMQGASGAPGGPEPDWIVLPNGTVTRNPKKAK